MKLYDLRTTDDGETINHNYITATSKRDFDYQNLKNSLSNYIGTVDITPTYEDIKNELIKSEVNEVIKLYLLSTFKKINKRGIKK